MNKNYDAFNRHQAGSKNYIGVTAGVINYSSLSMGAGEQRIFLILSEVVNAPNYGLIIIDEIDLLLHQDALFKLVGILNTIAIEKNLQIVFTTHAQSLLNLNFISVRHLYQTPTKTLCFTQTKPDALQRLTGHQIRPLEVFVEDDLAYTMIKKISAEEGLSKYVSVKKFGAAINCFTSAAGVILNNIVNQDNMLFVLDGDVYSTIAEKEDKISKVLTGNMPFHQLQRQSALKKITQFNLPDGESPERYFHRIICELANDILSTEQREIVEAARVIGNPGNNHKYFDDVIARMDYTRDVGLNKLVDLLSLTADWNFIKENIKNWLDSKRNFILEVEQQA